MVVNYSSRVNLGVASPYLSLSTFLCDEEEAASEQNVTSNHFYSLYLFLTYIFQKKYSDTHS